MEQFSELKQKVNSQLMMIDKKILLICCRVFNFFGFLVMDDHPYKTILCKFSVYYVRSFNIYYVLSSLVPIVFEKDIRKFSERIHLTVATYYSVIVSFVILYQSENIMQLLNDINNTIFEFEVAPMRKFKFLLYFYGMVVFSYLMNTFEAVMSKSGNFSGMWLPYNVNSSPFVYYSTCFVVFFSVMTTGSMLAFATTFFASFMMIFAELFKSLQEKIFKISAIDSKKLPKIERDQIIRRRFNECVAMHRWILRQFKRSRVVFEWLVTLRSTVMGFAYGTTGIVILMELNEGNLRGLSAPVLFLFMTSFSSHVVFTLSEEMKYESLQVSHAWYGAEWESWPQDLRLVLPLAIARAQEPVVYRVAGMHQFTRTFFLQILYNCYSMFAFARETMLH